MQINYSSHRIHPTPQLELLCWGEIIVLTQSPCCRRRNGVWASEHFRGRKADLMDTARGHLDTRREGKRKPDTADTWRGGGVLRQGGAHCQPRIQKEACESRTASSAFLAPSGFSPGHLLLFQAGRSLGRVLRLCEPRSRDAWERPGPCSPGGCADASACREQGRGQKERPSQTPVTSDIPSSLPLGGRGRQPSDRL